MRWIRVPVALCLSLSVPSVAFAQVPPPPSGPATQPQPDPQPQPQPQQELSDEEKIEKAKNLYIEAEGLFNEGRFEESVPLYEEAYYLVPGKHGFAHKVGVSAYKSGDCNKANTYLKHFIEYGDPEKHGDKIDEAKQILGEISVSGCATETSTGGGSSTSSSSANVEDTENPLGDSTRDTRQQEAAQARKDKKDEKRGLLIGGAVLTTVGGLGLGFGLVGLGIANSSANTLRDLSSNNTMTGFPSGDYACRDVPADQCPFKLESRLKTWNTIAYVGFGVGGASLAAGVAMLAIYMVNKKKRGGAEEQPAAEGEAGVELSSIGPMMLPGGAGGGASVGIRF